MKRIGIIAFHNLHLMQFLYKYTDILDEQGIDYDVLYWNRDGVEYEKKFKGRAIRFDYPTSNYCSGIKKICGFLKCRAFFIRMIKQNQYNKLILLTTQTAVALSNIALIKYKNRYVFDFRDITKENNKLYETLVKCLINKSAFTSISSRGFLETIGENGKIQMSHNCRNLVCMEKALVKKQPVKITFWGMIRQIEFQKKICDYFGNDSRFELYYHGEGHTDELRLYSENKRYSNIYFTGRYFAEEISSFAESTHILMNLYENDTQQKPALTVKLYDGIRYGLPMLITKNSYMEEFVGRKSFAYYFSFAEDDKENILRWYEKIQPEEMYLEYKMMVSQINKDEMQFKNRLLTFTGK